MLESSAFVISETTPDHLVITSTGNFGPPLLYIGLFVAYTLLTFFSGRSVRRVFQQEKSPAELRAYVWRFRLMLMSLCVGSLGLFSLIFYNGGSIDLDRRADLATMRAKMTAFLPAQTGSVPLSEVTEATLDFKPNSRRIRLITDDADLGYPIWSDRRGQEEAVRVINRWLACAGCGQGGEAALPGGEMPLAGGKVRGGISYIRPALGKRGVLDPNLRTCRLNAGAADISFGTGEGGAILTVHKGDDGMHVTVLGPIGVMTFDKKQCSSIDLSLHPSPSAAAPAMDGSVNIVCGNIDAMLVAGVYFDRCGR